MEKTSSIHNKLKLNKLRISEDEDSFFLYNNEERKTASLKKQDMPGSLPSNNNTYSANTPPPLGDNINVVSKGNVEFGIHPIMERMAKENDQVKKWFYYYLNQLLGLQCQRIIKYSRKNDNSDDIYDIDTVHGSFMWKNELRKHWIRSRLETKKLMQPLPSTNPFIINSQFNKFGINGNNKELTKIKTATETHPQTVLRDSNNFLDLDHLEVDEDDYDNWFGVGKNDHDNWLGEDDYDNGNGNAFQST
eukprot:289064_1